jgi:tetratricopeptide (TPR) repeat protein
MMESLFPQGHWFTAVCAGNLGSVLLRQGRLEEAEPLLKQAIDGHTLHYGENHSQTAHYLFSLGRLRARQGDTNTARELLTRVLSIWENTFGKDYPRCKNVREELDKLS